MILVFNPTLNPSSKRRDFKKTTILTPLHFGEGLGWGFIIFSLAHNRENELGQIRKFVGLSLRILSLNSLE